MAGKNLNQYIHISEIFNIAYSKLYPEYPPNYPIPFLWEKFQNLSNKKIIEKWQNSNNKHFEKSHVIYVHIPFCPSICKFCGFYREKLNSSSEIDNFLEKLALEASFFKDAFSKTKIKWLCLGGGTPSILNEKQLNFLFSTLNKNFNLNDTKIAFEALPSTLTLSKLKLLKDYGVYFLAIGVQSFNEKLLKNLNRFQTKKQAIEAVKNAKKVGINNIEVDLMIGLPGQTEEMFLNDIRIVSKLDLERIYIFDFQPRFFTGVEKKDSSLSEIPLEKWRNIRAKAVDILIKNGYLMRCGRWVYKREGEAWPYSYDQQEDGGYSILGLGPGAISYSMDQMRYQNIPDINLYFKYLQNQKLPIEKIKFLTQKDEMKNMLIVKLMHTGSIEANDFKERFNKNLFNEFKKEIKILTKLNLLLKTKNSLIAINRAKLQNALDMLFYSKSDISKLLKKLNIKEAKIDTAFQIERKFSYDSKLLNLSNDKMENLSFIKIKRKLGYKEIVFVVTKKISPLLLEFYNKYAKSNNFETSLIITYENYKFYLNKVNKHFKNIYIFIKDISLLKITDFTSEFKFITEYPKNFDKFLSKLKSFPEKSTIIFSQKIYNKNQKLNYVEIKNILAELKDIKNKKNINILFDEIPYCIIYPELNFFHSFKEFKLGDRRETNMEIIKLPQCLDCKYLLKCPGPDSKSIADEKNEKEINQIL